MLVIMENAAIVEQSKAYQVAKTHWQVVHILKVEDEAFQIVLRA